MLEKLQSKNYNIRKGDTKNLKFAFYDDDNNEINIETYAAKCTLTNMVTQAAVVTKEHNDGVSGGSGIYFFNDAEKPAGLGMTSTNQLVVVLSYFDTDLEPGPYRYDIEFTIDSNKKTTPIAGFINITREETASVT